MKRIIITFFAVLITLTFNLKLLSAADTSEIKFFPSADVLKGYALSGEIKEYKGRKLFDLINGGGEVYFEYGFDTVFSARYTKGEAGVTIQFYTMENSQAAHSIYTFHSHPDDNIVTGFEGLPEINVQPNGIRFYISKYFIKIESFDEGDEVIKFVKSIAKEMITKIKAASNVTQLAPVLVPLPTRGLKKQSVKVLAGNITAGAGSQFFQGNPIGFKKEKPAYFGSYELTIDGKKITYNIAMMEQSDYSKGYLLFKMGKKLFGSKEAALSKSFYVDNMPIMGFTKENIKYFVFQIDRIIYIITEIKDADVKLLIKNLDALSPNIAR
jgi:hypothetical protein